MSYFMEYLKLNKVKTQVYFIMLLPPSGSILKFYTAAAQPFPFPAPPIGANLYQGLKLFARTL